MNYNTSEYNNSKVAQKIDFGTIVLLVLTVAIIAEVFVQLARII